MQKTYTNFSSVLLVMIGYGKIKERKSMNHRILVTFNCILQLEQRENRQMAIHTTIIIHKFCLNRMSLANRYN